MFDEVVTVSFKLSGHRSREEATLASKKGNKKSAITIQLQVMIQS